MSPPFPHVAVKVRKSRFHMRARRFTFSQLFGSFSLAYTRPTRSTSRQRSAAAVNREERAGPLRRTAFDSPRKPSRGKHNLFRIFTTAVRHLPAQQEALPIYLKMNQTPARRADATASAARVERTTEQLPAVRRGGSEPARPPCRFFLLVRVSWIDGGGDLNRSGVADRVSKLSVAPRSKKSKIGPFARSGVRVSSAKRRLHRPPSTSSRSQCSALRPVDRIPPS